MAISCSWIVFEALEGLTFPADKEKVLSYASSRNASKGVIIGLDRLQEGVQYQGINEICDNASIVCSVETYFALQGLEYPADREAIVSYARSRGATQLVMEVLEQLSEGHGYQTIADICRNLPTSWIHGRV